MLIIVKQKLGDTSGDFGGVHLKEIASILISFCIFIFK